MITGIATAVGVILRQELGKKHFNPFLLNFLAAFLGGCIGGVAVQLGWSSTSNSHFEKNQIKFSYLNRELV